MDQKSTRAKIAATQPRSSGGRFAPKAKSEQKEAPVQPKPVEGRPFETPRFLQNASYPLSDMLRIAITVFIIVMLSTFGIQHAVCDKGVQTQVGTVKVLKAKSDINPLENATNVLLQRPSVKKDAERIVLFNPKNEAVQLLAATSVGLKEQDNKRVFLTGHYNSCKQKMYVTSSDNVEALQ